MRLKKLKEYKTQFIGLRCTDEQYNKIKRAAFLYTEGNISEFCLYALINFEIDSDDLEKDQGPVLGPQSIKRKSNP